MKNRQMKGINKKKTETGIRMNKQNEIKFKK